ncbi:MAG: hypothetical protein PHP98_01495 [Kiritimatiellae bacterium]|nr:hypothetical protein [Kiritimatiellia bacterium]
MSESEYCTILLQYSGINMFISGLTSVTFRKLSCRKVAALVKKAGLAAIEWGGEVHVPHGDIARGKCFLLPFGSCLAILLPCVASRPPGKG